MSTEQKETIKNVVANFIMPVLMALVAFFSGQVYSDIKEVKAGTTILREEQSVQRKQIEYISKQLEDEDQRVRALEQQVNDLRIKTAKLK